MAAVSLVAGTVDSGVECDLMIATLQRELDIIKTRLEQVLTLTAVNEDSQTKESQSYEYTAPVEKSLVKYPPIRKKIPKTSFVSAKQQTVSWEQQQYYVNLVNERERQIIEKRKQCLHLMEKHITEQLIALEETNKRLKFKLQQRLAKDKVSRLLKKPIRTRSYITPVADQIPPCKSTYYKNVDSLQTNGSYIHRNKSSFSTDKCIDTRIEIIEESEPSNSWAITGSAPINYTNDKKQEIATKDISLSVTATSFPVFKSLSDILGDNKDNEEDKHRAHTAKMSKLSNTYRQLHHMYRMSQHNQMQSLNTLHTNSIDELVALAEVPKPTTPPIVTPATPPTVKPTASSLVKLVTPLKPATPLLVESISDFVPSSPSHIAPHPPPLTLDNVLDNAPVIKESRTTCLWYNYKIN